MNSFSPVHAHKSILAFAALVALAAAFAVGGNDATAAKKQKIVALTPFSANTLAYTGTIPVAVGAQAAGHKAGSPKLKRVKKLALSHPNGPNMEEIAKIDPDVVLSAQGWAKGNQTMKDLAITVRNMDPLTVNQVVPRIKAIGKAYSSKKATDKFAKKIQRQIKYGKSGRPIKSRPTVLLILGVGRSPNIFLKNTWGASVATAAGAKLLGSELNASGGFTKVSDEYILQQNPDMIIAVPHGNANDIPEIQKHYENNPAWSTTKAVQSGNVHVITDDALLQPDTDVGNTIKRLRVKYLKNW
jgi:iron complex transport system substrate-binding protein